MELADEKTIVAALNVYAGLKRRLEKYRLTHPEVFCKNSRDAYYRLKEDPERYAAYLKQRSDYQKRKRREKKEKEMKALEESTESPEN
jgi:hypothetical protein